jgi:hypothetical protein
MFMLPYVVVDDKPSNMELRQRCILTMQKEEKAVEHSVSCLQVEGLAVDPGLVI